MWTDCRANVKLTWFCSANEYLFAIVLFYMNVFKKGCCPIVSRCTQCCNQYHCPFCETYKATSQLSIDNHVENHLKLAVHHDGEYNFTSTNIMLLYTIWSDYKWFCYFFFFLLSYFVIVKCNLHCRENAHFHCCYCPATVLRNVQLITPLQKCKKKVGYSWPGSSISTPA